MFWRCDAKATLSSETSVTTYPATQRLIPENRHSDYTALKETQIIQHSNTATTGNRNIISEMGEERGRSVM